MKSFVRATRLSNIGGRGDYISNPDRQEKILAKSAPVDWKPYQEFEAANQKTNRRNNEGRELVIALPNAWSRLSEKDLSKRAQSIAEAAIQKTTDLQWAVHWNKAHTNLHLHVVFSERQREDQGVWDRNIYQTAEGKVARTKAERAKGEDGKDLPPIHRKGEPKGGFTAKDHKYATQKWLHETKGRVQLHMTEKWNVRFDERGLLHEFHEGKGKEAPKIRAKNEVIRAINLEHSRMLVDPAYSVEDIEKFHAAALREVERGCSTPIYPISPTAKQIGACDLEHWKKRDEGNAPAIAVKPYQSRKSLFGFHSADKEIREANKALRERQIAVEAAQKARESSRKAKEAEAAAEAQRKAERHAEFEAVRQQMEQQKWQRILASEDRRQEVRSKAPEQEQQRDPQQPLSWDDWKKAIAKERAAMPQKPQKEQQRERPKKKDLNR